MPGKKDKKARSKDRVQGGGKSSGGGAGLSSMLGFGMDPGGRFLILHR